MSSRRLRWLGFALCVWIVAAASLAQAQATRPNVVLIISDDAGYADFGFQNQFSGQTTQFKTPRLDQLAQQSVLFSNGYVSAPLCAPSRAGLLTGRYQQRFGTEGNFTDAGPTSGMPASEVLISERFKQIGYTTGMVGKWHQGEDEPRRPHNQGFDESFAMLAASSRYFNAADMAPVYRNGVAVPWYNELSFNGVPNDPTYGRFITDAYGDEASKFIANHANDAEPFLLYTAFTAPHFPNTHRKESDYAQFSSNPSLTNQRKWTASMTYGMDRNIGQILDRLDDPNRDGNTADSIRNNTIVIYVNDNGGVEPSSTGPYFDNTPLRGYKGSSFEGGIRIPFIISAPGVAPSVVHDMVSTIDLFPTLLAAAGGGGSQPTELDGVDLMPRLTGQQTGPVHEALFWRMGVSGFAVRKGDWKLVKGQSFSPIELFHLNPNGTGETVNLVSQYPEKVEELVRDYVGWEVTKDKLKWSLDSYLNTNDEFIQRNDLSGAGVNLNFNWLWGNGWRDGSDPNRLTRLQRVDAAPNTVLIFETRNDANYTSLNNLNRAVSTVPTEVTPPGLSEYMLNEVRLRGNFTSSTARSATLSGIPLMMVNNLSGRQPRIGLDANRSATADYTFSVNMDLVLYHDLLLTGNGTANFRIGGVIRDFYEPKSVVKDGTSSMTLVGHNTYKGQTEVRQGTLRLNAATSAIDGSSRVIVSGGASLLMSNGLIKSDRLSVEPGGTLTFTGGQIATNQVNGTFVNQGGVFAPSLSFGVTPMSGNFIQSSGTLAMEIGAAAQNWAFDRLSVSGTATLGGVLSLSAVSPNSLTLGQSFEILTAFGGIHGGFTSLVGPVLAPGLAWSVQYTPSSVLVNVVQDAGSGGPVAFLTRWKQSFGVDAGGDADADGDTDGDDFLKWQRGEAPYAVVPVSYISLWKSSFGSSNVGDINGDGRTDGTDFLLWQRHAVGSAAISAGVQLVPEPATGLLALAAFSAVAVEACRHRAGQTRRGCR
jgi:autotransporter-associated beta strand protein